MSVRPPNVSTVAVTPALQVEIEHVDSMCEDVIISLPGSDLVQLKDILLFTCGCDTIPLSGLTPQPSLLFYDGAFPVAATCSNELTLPTVHTTYYNFRQGMIQGIVGGAGLFGIL